MKDDGAVGRAMWWSGGDGPWRSSVRCGEGIPTWNSGHEEAKERGKSVWRILTLVRCFAASCWRREAMEWRIDGELESLASTVARCVSEQGTSAREGK